MPNQWYPETDDDDDDDDNTSNRQPPQLPAGLRKHLQRIEKENKELKKELDESKAQKRTETIANTVKAKGYDPLIAAFVPASVEATSEAVEKWLTDNGRLFAAVTTNDAKNDGGSETTEESTKDGVPPDVVKAMQLINGAAAGITQTPTREADLMKLLTDPNLTKEKLDEIVRTAGPISPTR